MTELADEPRSLLDWVTGLATDPVLRARFADEPRSVLDEQGLTDLRPADLHHALPLVSDSVAARLGADVDPAALSTTAAQLAGEDPASALARQLGVVADSVLAAGATAPPTHDIDDDPVELDDLDDPAPVHDLDDVTDPGTHHDHDLDPDLDGPADHPVATVTVLPVDPPGGTDDAEADGLVVVTPPEEPAAFVADDHVDLLPDIDSGVDDGDTDLPPHDPGPDDPGPDDAGVESFA